jgi:Flp pilus assembly protein TadB
MRERERERERREREKRKREREKREREKREREERERKREREREERERERERKRERGSYSISGGKILGKALERFRLILAVWMLITWMGQNSDEVEGVIALVNVLAGKGQSGV